MLYRPLAFVRGRFAAFIPFLDVHGADLMYAARKNAIFASVQAETIQKQTDMKLKSLILAAAAIIVTATSCGVLGGNNNKTATAQGTSVGAALASLYGQYKTDGKIDLGNITNIINIATIANNLGVLKTKASTAAGNVAVAADNTANAAGNALATILAQYGAGLGKGSGGLVNEKNSTSILGTLGTLANVDLSAITGAVAAMGSAAGQAAGQAAAAAAPAVNASTAGMASAVSAISSIFKTFE